MEHIITTSIGIGLVISLMFSELLGLAAGGMVVPGYIALYINQPVAVMGTLFVSFLTYFIVRTLSSYIIIYGRRRTVLMILVGFLLGWFLRSLEVLAYKNTEIDLVIVGYIIPGLIAIWMERQGILETITTLITSSIIIRLLLILIFGKEVIL